MAGDGDASFENTLIRLLSERREVYFFGRHGISVCGNGHGIILADCGGRAICGEDTVIVLKDSCRSIPTGGGARIINSDNPAHTALLSKRLPKDSLILTCGPSAKDSVTYSSISDDGMVVALQREISVGGHVTEPFELPIRLCQNDSIYGALAAYALLIYDGEFAFFDGADGAI